MTSINGTPGPDRLNGTARSDHIHGLDGGDTIDGRAGADFLFGNAGNDHLIGGTGADDLCGGRGNDTLDSTGTDADDVARYDQEAGTHRVVVNLNTGRATDTFGNHDRLIDVSQAFGTEHNDRLSGGNDTNDDYESFAGLRGADTMVGGSGFDALRYDRDYLYTGGRHGVVVNFATGTATDGFGTVDTFRAMEDVACTKFADRVMGGSGDEVIATFAGDDTVNGGAGSDWLDGRFDEAYGAKHGMRADLAAGRVFDSFGDVDTVRNVENVIGSTHADVIRGSDGINQLRGWLGSDRIEARDGNDQLVGDNGRDTLIGGAGNDTLIGGVDSDSMTGGAGRDIFVIGGSVDHVRDFRHGIDKVASPRSIVGDNPDIVVSNDPNGATDAHQPTIILERDAGRFWFDADGRGGDRPNLVAIFENHPAFTADDILLV